MAHNDNGFLITSNRLIRWGAIVGAVAVISTGLGSGMNYVGWPPYASAANLEEVQIRVIRLTLDVLNTDYDRLLAVQRAFQLADKPVPQSLVEQIRDKCREVRAAGGRC